MFNVNEYGQWIMYATAVTVVLTMPQNTRPKMFFNTKEMLLVLAHQISFLGICTITKYFVVL